MAADVDQRLGELNVEYHSKRASGRLAPLTIALLRQGAGEAYKTACVRAGQREGQFKPAVLQYRRDLALLVRALCHRVSVAIDRIRFRELRIPFKVAFRHASAERTETETVWIDAVALMEASAAASRVPGRTSRAKRSPRRARSRRGTRRRCGSDVTDVETLRAWVDGASATISTPIPPRGARWSWRCWICSASDIGTPVETLLVGAAARRRAFRYTAVLGDASASAFHAMAEQYWRTASGTSRSSCRAIVERDREKMAVFGKWPEESIRVRADANNLWRQRTKRRLRPCAPRLPVLCDRGANRQGPARGAAPHRTRLNCSHHPG